MGLRVHVCVCGLLMDQRHMFMYFKPNSFFCCFVFVVSLGFIFDVIFNGEV